MKRLSVSILLLILTVLLIGWLSQPNRVSETEVQRLTSSKPSHWNWGGKRDAEGLESTGQDSVNPIGLTAAVEAPDGQEGNYCPERLPEYFCFDRDQGMEPLVRNALAGMEREDYLSAVKIWYLLQFCENTPRSETELLGALLYGYRLDSTVYQAFSASELSESKYASPSPHASSSRESNSRVRVEYGSALQFCSPVHALIDGGFRERVMLNAERGNEAYRLLFTLWRPEFDSGFKEHLVWQLQSLDYSEESISSGSAMGLIAKSWGYMMGSFTSHQIIIGWSYGRAALDCGVDPRAVPHLVHYIKQEEVERFYQGLFSGDAVQVWPKQLARTCL